MSAFGPLILVAAVDRVGAIGRAGMLPWHLPADLQRFKARTRDHVVLMGSATARSIGRALPNRRNLVLTRSGSAPFPGQEAVASLTEARQKAGREPLLVLGGARVYEEALPEATDLWLTLVDTSTPDADTFFPVWSKGWRETARDEHPADERHAHAFAFVDYRRAGSA